jgi:hypothetical protein
MGSGLLCHGNHSHHHRSHAGASEEAKQEVVQLVPKFTGQGNAVFSWDKELTAAFPADARPYEKDLHGGFSEDSETGIVYTGIPGYGLCAISRDLREWKRVGNDDRLKANIHGLCVFKHKGTTNIALAQNEDARILIVALDGTIKQELPQPEGGEFNFDEANAYYSNRPLQQAPWGKKMGMHVPTFCVTDVAYLDGKLYAVTGYSAGDFCLAAHEVDGKWRWGPFAWGGKGSTPGKFTTAHGIFAYNDSILIANRNACEVIEYTKEGKLIRFLPDIPAEALICNVARADDYFVMNALEPVRCTPAKTAAIYAHDGQNLVSTIEPGELGIPVLKHLHHVWPHYIPGATSSDIPTLHLLIHGWALGKFAVLRHEPKGTPSPPLGRWDRSGEPMPGGVLFNGERELTESE